MALSKPEVVIILSSPSDWDKWLVQFESKAVSLSLWNHVDEGEALLVKPQIPRPAEYLRPQPSPAQSTRSQTAEASATAATAEEALAVVVPGRLVTANNLTAVSRAAYQADL